MSEWVCELPIDGMASFVSGTTTIPVRELIVRCRDCERFAVDQSDHEYRSGWWCKRWDTDMVKPDGFCAWGKRKGERMSITKELREFMDGADGYEIWCPHHKVELTSIADRIDAEHERAMADAYLSGTPTDEKLAEPW